MLLVALVGTVCGIVSSYLSARVSAAYGRDLRGTVFAHATSAFPLRIRQDRHGFLITRTTNDVSQVQAVVLMSLRIFMTAPMMLIGGIILAFSGAQACRCCLLPFCLYCPGNLRRVQKVLPLFKQLQASWTSSIWCSGRAHRRQRVIRAFDRIDYETRRFDEASRITCKPRLRFTALCRPDAFDESDH